MHYGSCRKIESARLLFPLPIVPPRAFFSLSPALHTYTEASPKGSLLRRLRADASLTSITFLDHEKCYKNWKKHPFGIMHI